MSGPRRRQRLPIPPNNAERFETVCQFCSAGCGYTVFRWPVGRQGGPDPTKNALQADFRTQQPALLGRPYTEAMHTTIEHQGRRTNLAVVPTDASPANINCEHSSRGAHNALTTFSRDRGTRDRLTRPLLKVGGTHRALSWEDATELLAALLVRIHDELGPDQLTAKAFDHGGGGGGFENNFAVGRLFFDALGMKNVAIHNRPAYNSEVWGSRDRGVHELHSTAEDARLADTLVYWGANPYETASAYFNTHALSNLRGETMGEKMNRYESGEFAEPARVIVIDPRRSSTVGVAEAVNSKAVLHLAPQLGTDVVLADAIARAIWSQGLADTAMLKDRSDPKTFANYQAKSLRLAESADTVLDNAARITGVPREKIEQAARWIAAPKPGGHRRRTLTLYEKGVIWNQRNYDTVAAVVQVALLSGNIGRPGTGCSRQGGHQEGYVRPPYPGPRPPINVDELLMEGGGKLYWVVGTNPFVSTPRAQHFGSKVRARLTGMDGVIAGWAARPRARIEALADALFAQMKSSQDLFMVVSELYLTETAQHAHLVLPAAGWGEMNLTSINCHSRLLRLYTQFMDPPGQARPDWKIMAAVAQAMARRYRKAKDAAGLARCSGFDWKDDEAVFLAGGATFADNRVDEVAAETLAAECYKGVDYALLRKLGQQGIATPVRTDPKTGALVGTVRRYTHRFATPNGHFSWHGSDPWAGYPAAIDKYLKGPTGLKHPYWLTTGRSQHWWQTGYHDRRIPQKLGQVPYPYVEIHPKDAKREGLAGGELVELFNEEGRAEFLVHVIDGPRPGILFAMQFHAKGSASNLVSNYTDPKTTIPWYKGARVGIRRSGHQAIVLPSLQPNNLFGT